MKMLEWQWWKNKMHNKTVLFWIGIFSLNFLLFLPHYLIHLDSATFIPLPFTGGRSFWLFEFLFNRRNMDTFRVSVELFILVSLAVLLRKHNTWYRFFCVLILIVYPVFLLYQLYEAFYIEAYNADPLFYSDYLILEELIPLYFLDVLNWEALVYVIGGLVSFFLLVGGIVYVLRKVLLLIRQVSFGRYSYILFGILGIFCLITIVKYKYENQPFLAFQRITAKLTENIGSSLESYRWNKNYDPQKAEDIYNYENVHLQLKPNVHLIAIESYGSLMANDPYFQPMYDSALQLYEQRLQGHGWYAASALSKAPVSGGRSWLSFTSLMCGINIDNHGAFKMLLNSHQDYPNLMRFFKKQGYHNYRLHPVPNIGSGVPMDLYNRFYAFDRWIYYEDIPYQGDYYRWLFMPDQYVFNYALEEVIQSGGREASDQHGGNDEPYFFFFININSHYTWKRDRLPVYADWKEMNQPGVVGDFVNDLKNNERGQAYLYYRAIEYQLDYLTDYIARSADDNSLFILIGDHQPPIFSTSSFDTPLHIISKDPDLIDSFLRYGLQPGLHVNKDQPALVNHEGLYSLLVRELDRNYGTDTLHLPPYYPEGIPSE